MWLLKADLKVFWAHVSQIDNLQLWYTEEQNKCLTWESR